MRAFSSMFLVLLPFAFCLTQGANLPYHQKTGNVWMSFDILVKKTLTEENVEINYDDNYVKIATPTLDDSQSMVTVHDYTQDITLFKSNGRCFLMNEYNDMPKQINDWLKLQNAEGFLDAGAYEDLTTHLYKLVPFSLNTTALPAVMRRECSDDIQIVVLEQTIHGGDGGGYEQLRPGDVVMKGSLFLPPTCSRGQGGRSKRSADYCGGCRQCDIAIHL